jgi:hypothetical protein
MRKILIKGMPFLAAILALLAFVPWVLGIPGVRGTDFARGWEIGFISLTGYLAAYFVVLMLKLLRRLFRLGVGARLTDAIAWIALVLLVGAQAVAWRLILG